MRRPNITPQGDDLIEREARKRADCLSNKQIAERTGQALGYIAKRVAYIRRKIEMVSRGTDSGTDTDSN